MLKFKEASGKNGVGDFFGRSRFRPEAENTCIFTWFLLVFTKWAKAFEGNFQEVGLLFFGKPELQKEAFRLHFYVVFLRSIKNYLVAKPLCVQGGGRDQSPKRPKKGPKPAFLRCFLVLHKSEKVASQPHLKRASCELFAAPGPQEKLKTCIFTVFFSSQEQKTCIFTGFQA